ncbi:TetR family transcriptional regulator [Leucobacter sp. CSA2]|uniref:TetR family transcriptional regulator n=1 Tax=Leucobacter edaphi TaxID=2796472 RepID=A0A934QAL2_9MICO|nr:TetR family transcriptional regulator [Leucobacter edaphi]
MEPGRSSAQEERSEPARTRKPAAERRAEIVSVASEIALEDGLERITLRAVADRLGVRQGLIGHYFPAVGELVAEAFTAAVTGERDRLVGASGTPTERIAALVRRVERQESEGLARLWLNARHLARRDDRLADVIEAQEALDRARLEALVSEGIAAGEFPIADAGAACVRIFMAVDGFGAYANNPAAFDEPAYAHFVSDVAAWALGIGPAALRAE